MGMLFLVAGGVLVSAIAAFFGDEDTQSVTAAVTAGAVLLGAVSGAFADHARE